MYYSGKDYDEVDEVALRLRIDYGHLDYYLDVIKLAKQLNIVLTKYSTLTDYQLKTISGSEELKDGLTIIKKARNGYEFYTYYNDKISTSRIRYTIAHEIKHVVFLEINPSKKEEALADHFAIYILAPPCLIMSKIAKGYDPSNIAYDFKISYEAAGYAYDAAISRLLYNKANLSDFEEEFIDKFDNNKKKT